MAKIKIKDLSEDRRISWEEMRKVAGGGFFADIGQFYDDSFAMTWQGAGAYANAIADWMGSAVSGGSSGGSGSGGGGGGGGSGVPTRRK